MVLCAVGLSAGLAGDLHAQIVSDSARQARSAASVPSRAEVRPDTAEVDGIVVGPDDARLPGVTVTITNTATRQVLTIVTADHGRFSGSNLAPGEYDLTATLDGFLQGSARLTLGAGESRAQNFKLALATVSESVNVIGSLVKETIAVSEIRESTARDVGEALAELNGVYKIRKGAIANDIIVHGFQSRNLTVLIDGDRVYGACPNGMDPAAFHADFAEVDHLDVGKGPYDVRHEGSLGGVVNVVTRAPAQGLHASPNLAFGSSGYINPSVTASAGTAAMSVLGGFSFRTSDAYEDGSGTLYTQYANYRPDQVAGKAFTANTGWVRGFVSPGAGHSVQVAYTRQKATDVKYAYLQMDGIWDTADRASVSYEWARHSGWFHTVAARAYYTRVNHWMTDQFRTTSIGMAREYSMASQANTNTAGGSVEAVLGSISTGVEAYRRNWDISTLMAGMKYAPQYSVPDVSIDHLGAFVEHRRTLGAGTKVEVGGRVDWSRSAADASKANTGLYYAYNGTRSTSTTDAGVSAKARVTHRVGNLFELTAGVGHTERVPDPQERYYSLKRTGSDWVGSPNLRTTGNTGVTGGLSYTHRRAVVSASVYHDRLTDYITVHSQKKINAVPGIMNSAARSYANVDARMWTGELTATCPVTDSLFTSFNASYTRATKDPNPALGITSPNVAEIHPFLGTASIRYDRSAYFGEIQAVFSGKHVHVDTDLQEEPMPAYGVLNLKVGGQKRNVRVTFAVDNVLDALYVDHMSYQRDPFRLGTRVREPGRNYYVNVAYRF
jgi:iron complex outermembrane receptor protein